MTETVLKEMLEAENIIIYGAHLVALECARWIVKHGKRDSIAGFAVTDMDGNPRELLGIPVKKAEEYAHLYQSSTVMIAMPEKFHSEVELYVKSKGADRIVKISLEEMSRLKMKQLLLEQENYPALSFRLTADEMDASWLNMYVKEETDKALADVKKNRHYKFPTLFHMECERVFQEVLSFDFKGTYEEVCGQYRNVHMILEGKKSKAGTEAIENIMKIYSIFSIRDSAKVRKGQYAPWIVPLQAGGIPEDGRYKTLSDAFGDNISDKNSVLAEMTGAYWIWKNAASSKYKGLCHYRRHFDILKEEIEMLESSGVDIVLTTPRYVPGGIKNMFLAETPVKSEVYHSMILAISEVTAEDRKAFEAYMEKTLYYPNNMVVARNSIYNDYCAWLFPILFRMLKIDLETGYGHESDRHIAYAAELLTSYYFIKNKDKYCIAVTDYRLLE